MTIKPIQLLVLLALTSITSSAHAIEDGFEAEPCAWPEVVRVFSGWGMVGDLDGPDPITCTGVYLGGRTVLTAAECVNRSPSAYEVHFGELFGLNPRDTLRLRMAIPVEDCRTHPVLPVAACTLREAPTMQTIPILAPCEVDELLVSGAELLVVGANSSKLWAAASLSVDVSSAATSFELPNTIWTTQAELSSQILEPDDLGAPLYVRAPDGSLRIAGVTVGVEPGRWIGAWMLVDWLLDEEAQEVVLPCHSLVGEWAPSPSCAMLLGDRELGEGEWGRDPAVCETTQVVVPTPTCVP